MAAIVEALPEGRRGRVLALGVTLLLLALAWFGAVQPLIDVYAAGDVALRQRRELAGRMADLAGTLGALRQQAATLATAGPPTTATLTGATDAIAAASLQSLVESMTGTAGAHLTSAEALPAEQLGAYRRVALRVSVDAKWATLVGLLQAIGRATPRMFVDELQLHAQPTGDKVPEQPLDIAFTVLAFRAATSAGGAAAGSDTPAGDDDSGPGAGQ
jgi:general secretion pathway protein M